MNTDTKISWTAATWNPMSGCAQISPECRFCYAETLAENRRGTAAFPNGFDLTIREHKLREPANLLKSKTGATLIFCNSMSDPGLVEIPDDYLRRIFATMAATPEHRYQVLTKRPDVLLERVKRLGIKVGPWIWLGVTIGTQSSAWRLDVAKEFRALGVSVIFVSAEPLLGALELDLRGVDWLIGGGESGTHAVWPAEMRAAQWPLVETPVNPWPWMKWFKASHHGALPATQKILLSVADEIEERFLVRRMGGRPVRAPDGAPIGATGGTWTPTAEAIGWVRKLRDDCATTGTAFWFKQWGGSRPEIGGRLLDGKAHDGLPLSVPNAMPKGYDHATRHGAARQLSVLPT